MSVYRHQRSPYWQFDFIVHGYRFSGSTEIPRNRPKREAQAVEEEERRAAERLIEEVRRSGREPMTVSVAIDRWWSEVGEHGSEGDMKPWLDWLKAQLGPDKKLHQITDNDVSRAVAERRKATRKAGKDENGRQLYRPITARTVNRSVPLLLRRIVRRAKDSWNAVIFNEPKWTKHLLAERKRPIAEITIDAEDRLDGVERGEYQKVRRFATITGLRATECLLTWPQVDFENACVRIVGKGDQPRVVPLSKEAYALLWGERGNHETHVFTFVAQRTRRCGKSKRDYVRGKRYPITYWGLNSNRVRHWKKAGVTSRFHDTRHTAGMRTLRSTGNLKTTQRLLGHSDIQTTAKFYVDAMVEDVREAMEATAKDVESRKKSRTDPQAANNSLKEK